MKSIMQFFVALSYNVMRYVKSFIDNTHVKIGIEKSDICVIQFKKDSFDIESKNYHVSTHLKFHCEFPIFIDY